MRLLPLAALAACSCLPTLAHADGYSLFDLSASHTFPQCSGSGCTRTDTGILLLDTTTGIPDILTFAGAATHLDTGGNPAGTASFGGASLVGYTGGAFFYQDSSNQVYTGTADLSPDTVSAFNLTGSHTFTGCTPYGSPRCTKTVHGLAVIDTTTGTDYILTVDGSAVHLESSGNPADTVSLGVSSLVGYTGGSFFYQDSSNQVYSGTSIAETTTPEPASLALLGTGALGLFSVARRRFNA